MGRKRIDFFKKVIKLKFIVGKISLVSLVLTITILELIVIKNLITVIFL